MPSPPSASCWRSACRCSESASATSCSGLASGARTVKMKFGHHGGNHPVLDLDSGRVMISSQNHGFAVDEATCRPILRPTHRSLFDGSLQGIARTDRPAFSFQGHPEASPGPHDVAPLFDRFIALLEAT
jgi:carbamoyl-phosphate synthase small subunit